MEGYVRNKCARIKSKVCPESTVGVTQFDKLPANAQRYLTRMSEVCGVPIDMVSTGPDRNETIMLRHPFKS